MSAGSTIGVVGGGQLGRMLVEAANPLGIEIAIIDPTPHAPASGVARRHIVAGFDDEEAIRSLAADVDVLTYEIELADPDALERAARETGTPIHPTPATLRTIQDKLVQNETFANEGIPVPHFHAADTPAEIRAACRDLGTPAMIKARRGGYDGRGNVPIENPDNAANRLSTVGGGPALVEEFIDFERELSVIGVRGAGDERRTYTPAENIHNAEILRESVVPARTDDTIAAAAEELAMRVLEALDGYGVFGIELFETSDGELLVNEVAPRPHNSGHWTIEGAVTSQFEQHARSVLGLPLGATTLRSPTATSNILGDVDAPQEARASGLDSVLAAGNAKLHWYGKREVRPLRKMGHISHYDPGADSGTLLDRVRQLRDQVTFR